MVYLFAWESCAWRGRRKPWHQKVLIPTHHRLGRNQEASVVLHGCGGSYGWSSTLACGVSRTFSRSDMEWWVVSGQAGWVTSLFRFVFEWVGTLDSRPRLLRGSQGYPAAYLRYPCHRVLVTKDQGINALLMAWCTLKIPKNAEGTSQLTSYCFMDACLCTYAWFYVCLYACMHAYKYWHIIDSYHYYIINAFEVNAWNPCVLNSAVSVGPLISPCSF